MFRCRMLGQGKLWVRRLGTTVPVCASHYDALGLTPKATQGDIKSAYYKLSMRYHPDKATNDEDSAKKFRAITEAYEVLGNIKLKKMYDKGLITGTENRSRMDYQPEPEPTDPTLKFYKSRVKRHIIPTMDGKTPIYDFDSWSKNHYGNILKDKLYEKEFLKKKQEKVMEANMSANQETYLYIVFTMVGLFMVLVANGTTDYDKDTVKNQNEKQEQFAIATSNNNK